LPTGAFPTQPAKPKARTAEHRTIRNFFITLPRFLRDNA
jgi:hypothetical protein